MPELCPAPYHTTTIINGYPSTTSSSCGAAASNPNKALLDPAEADRVLKMIQDASSSVFAPSSLPPVNKSHRVQRSDGGYPFKHPLAATVAQAHPAAIPHPGPIRCGSHRRRLCSFNTTNKPVAPTPSSPLIPEPAQPATRSMVPVTGRVFGQRVPAAAKGIDDWWLDPRIREGKELFVDPPTGQVVYLPQRPEPDSQSDGSWSSLLWSLMPIPPMPPIPQWINPWTSQLGEILVPLLSHSSVVLPLWPVADAVQPPATPATPATETKVFEPPVQPTIPAILITPPDLPGVRPRDVLPPQQPDSNGSLTVPKLV